MNLRKAAILVIILAFINICESQRGGGRSRSSSRSSSRSYSGRSTFGSGRTSRYNTTSNSNSSGGGFIWALLGVGALGIFGYSKYTGKNQISRIQRIQKLFTSYEGIYEGNMCTLSQSEMERLKNEFMSKKWKIQFQTFDNSFKDISRATITQNSSRSKYSYNFKMTMSDSVGNSKCTGILLHQEDYFGIKFQKTYNDRQYAGQTGAFDLLLYEGVQQGDCFKGSWGYENQATPQYCGTWEMYCE